VSLLRRLSHPVRDVAPQGEARSRINVSGGGYFLSSDGVESDPLKSVAHWAARRVLCTSVASLPVMQVRESAGRRERLSTQSQIVRSPSGQVKRRVWVYQVMDSLLDDGNVYGLVGNVDSRGFPLQVETVAPADVEWVQDGNRVVPHVNGTGYGVYPNGFLWHSPCFVRAGSPIGLSPSKYHAQSVRTSIAAEKFGGDFFTAGAHPTHKVKVNEEITVEQAQQIKANILRATRSREPFVHGSDIELSAMQVSPTDSQFLELLRFECEQASRIYGVPPQMIYAATSGQNVTYANASQSDLQFLKHSLGWWVTILQDEWSAWLPEPQVVRFNTDAFLRMTAEERTKIHDMRLKQKTRTVNEVRVIEDELPFDDPMFDEPGIPGVDSVSDTIPDMEEAPV
jgi:HK97 family phage portal protein